MCGIFAAVGRHIDQKRVDAALLTLRRRGPDDQGSLPFNGCTLAQTRLSIVDLSARGHQPMPDNARPQAISFNGEIYGYKELRKELERRSHTFSSDSDTETILKAYSEYGANAVDHLDGMFAFALWDDTAKSLFLARDRFGKKPLYYAYDADGSLVVASEIKALIAYGIKPIISPEGIDAYLALMYLPPTMTFFSNVYTLPPGHRALFKNGALTVERYWRLEEKPELVISYEEAREETRRIFTDAVRKRMIADVEIGSFLSGGVDSTLITAYAAKMTDPPIKTFSLGYGDYINELPYADEAARTIGTDHRTMQAGADLIPELESLMAYLDEPHADSANLAQSVLSQFTSEHVKVALAGDGGDELFMGYGWYWAYHNRPKIIALKNALLSDQFSEHMKSVTVFTPALRERFMRTKTYHSSYVPEHVSSRSKNDAHRINAYDFANYLPGQLLTKVDRTSMMHGLEVRCPLLDYRLAEFAYQLPLEHKINRVTGKFILKDLLAEIMPRSFVDRKKQGFGAPVRKWLMEPKFRDYAAGKLGERAHIYEHLDRGTVAPFITKTLSGDAQKDYYRVWVLLCLELWLQAHSS